MTPDKLDQLIRNAFPPGDVPPQQVGRVMDGVFARLDRAPAPGGWLRLQALLAEMTPSWSTLVRQTAIPAGMALALGLYVGQFLHPQPQTTLLAGLTTPSLFLADQ